jgi:hypothetical protein
MSRSGAPAHWPWPDVLRAALLPVVDAAALRRRAGMAAQDQP